MPGRTPTLNLRANSVLTNSYVASPSVKIQSNVKSGAFTVSYASVEAASYPSIIIEMSENDSTWSKLGISDGTLTVSSGSASTSIYTWTWNVFVGGIGAATSDSVDFIVSVPQKSFMRVSCKENGVVADHGSLSVDFIGDVD